MEDNAADNKPQTPHEALANPPDHALDQELSAIRTIHGKLRALSPTARLRVWKYVAEVMEGEP